MFRSFSLVSIPALFCSMIFSGCGPTSVTIGAVPNVGVQEHMVDHAGWLVADRIAIIEVTGLIHNSRTRGFMSESENPVGLLHEMLEHARKDANVKAVVLRINSPGGTVTASDAMYREITRFRQMSKKPVVALMMDVAASGGYYIACATDRIYAYPTTVTGSIGVIMQTMSLQPALSTLGIQTDAITSGPNKDAGSPFSRMSAEQRDIFQKIVDDFYGRFVDVVRQGRPQLDAAKIRQLADGRIYTGTQALGHGLVDQNGDLYDALTEARKLAGVKEAHAVLYKRQGQFAGSVYAGLPPQMPGGTQINLAQVNLDGDLIPGHGAFSFLYLWRP